MKNEGKAIAFVCFGCGMAWLSGEHMVDLCLRGEWCKPIPIHLPDLPHKHPLPLSSSTTVQVMDTGSAGLNLGSGDFWKR
jgi:hypothetical protein